MTYRSDNVAEPEQPDTIDGVRRRIFFISMKCYLCTTPMRPLFEKNGYMIYRCPSCGLAQTDLRQDYDEFVREHYAKGYFTGDASKVAYVDYKDDKPMIVRNMRVFLQAIKREKPEGRLLDVGCALGFFVELALREGYDAYGFDPSGYAVAEAKKLVGADRIREASTHTATYPEHSFDVITLFDVFEHLADPARDLARLYKFLKPDGILVLATGDTDSVLARTIKRRWTFYIPPQHLFFFNRKTLTTLLTREGFTPARWFRIGKWLSLRYVLHLAGTTGQSAIGKLLYEKTSRTPLGKVPLWLPVRDNMVVIARKTSNASL